MVAYFDENVFWLHISVKDPTAEKRKQQQKGRNKGEATSENILSGLFYFFCNEQNSFNHYLCMCWSDLQSWYI